VADDGGRRRTVVDRGRVAETSVGQQWVTSDSDKPS